MIYLKVLHYFLFTIIWICENDPNNDVLGFDILAIFSPSLSHPLCGVPWLQLSIRWDKIHGQRHWIYVNELSAKKAHKNEWERENPVKII